jgi:hypothetical protein
LYGYVSATKWVTDLEVTTWQARQAYWLKRGWGREAPIKTESRIDPPKGFETVPGGKVRVAGIAWAQHTGIERVEVRIDDGPWREATLSRQVNLDTWRMWWIEFDVPPGVTRSSAGPPTKVATRRPACVPEPFPTVPPGGTASISPRSDPDHPFGRNPVPGRPRIIRKKKFTAAFLE